MENQYGISIKNKYDLFLENDDPLEILKLQEEQKLAGKKADKTKKSSPDKETKSSAKSKQPKASPVPAATETKPEKSEVPTAAKTDSDKQQKRQKPESNDSRLLKDRGNRSNFKNDQASPQDSSGKLEIGTFENPGSSGSPRERRGRGRGFGGGFRGNNERSPRDGVDNGSERRPPRRGFGPRPRNTFRNNENHENFQSPEETQQDGVQGFRRGFGNQSFDDNQQNQTGFPDEKSEQNSGEERRGGFRGRRGFRTFNGEQRGFGGPRRNFENRPPKRGFRNGGASTHDEHAELNGSDDSRPSADHSTQQEQPASFGHWGAENETAGEDGTSGPATSNSGFGGSPRRGFRGFGGRRGGRGRGRGFDGRREFNRRGGNEGGFGVKPSDKRDGTGSHNWGTVMDDLEAQSVPAAAEENAGASWADQAEAAEIQEGAVSAASASNDNQSSLAAAAEPEPNTMTLDEYKASLESKRVKTEFNIRKPNDGCVDEKWRKMYVLKSKEDDKNEEEEEEEETEEDRHNRHKNIVPIEIKFADSRRGGLGSRGTGGGGGGGGRRGNRDNYDRGGYNRRGSGGPGASRGGGPERRQQRERAPNVADEKDFPSLGAIANN